MLPPYFLKLSLIPALQVRIKNDLILWFCNGNSRHSITYLLQNKIRMQLRGLFHPISIALSHHLKLSVDFSRDYSSLHSLYKYVNRIVVNLFPDVNPCFVDIPWIIWGFEEFGNHGVTGIPHFIHLMEGGDKINVFQ